MNGLARASQYAVSANTSFKRGNCCTGSGRDALKGQWVACEDQPRELPPRSSRVLPRAGDGSAGLGRETLALFGHGTEIFFVYWKT